MNISVKLKFGTPVMVISIIVGVIFALAGVGMMLIKDLIKELDPSLTEGLEGINFDGIFVFLGLILMVVAVVGIVAGVKAVYSKGWNLFIAIVHGMFAGFALISLNLITLAVSGVMSSNGSYTGGFRLLRLISFLTCTINLLISRNLSIGRTLIVSVLN